MFPTRFTVATLLLLVLAGPWLVPSAHAQVIETREGSSNPMVEVFKSTIYGGLAGLLLGSALALALDSDDNADTVKWAFVSGTFFGFGYGIYHVSTRPEARAMLEHGERGWALVPPDVTVEVARGAPGPTGDLARPAVSTHLALASIGF